MAPVRNLFNDRHLSQVPQGADQSLWANFRAIASKLDAKLTKRWGNGLCAGTYTTTRKVLGGS